MFAASVGDMYVCDSIFRFSCRCSDDTAPFFLSLRTRDIGVFSLGSARDILLTWSVPLRSKLCIPSLICGKAVHTSADVTICAKKLFDWLSRSRTANALVLGFHLSPHSLVVY